MPTVFLLNPRRDGRRRRNAGTSASVQRSWDARRAKYGVSGDRPGIKALHHKGMTISSMKRMSAAQKARMQRTLSAFGLSRKPAAARKPAARKSSGKAASKKSSRKPARRKNAWYERMAPGNKPAIRHGAAAKKKWQYTKSGSTPSITYYQLVRRYGVARAAGMYKKMKAAGSRLSYSAPQASAH